jgi:hypothetical protein
MKKLVKVLLALVALLVVALVVISLSLGSIIKKGVETAGPKVAKVKMTLDSASLSLLGGSGTLKGLFIGNPEGYKTESAVKVGTAHLAVAPRSVMSDKVVIHSIKVDAPEITIEGDLSKNNLTQIQKNIEAFLGSPAAKEEAATDKGAGKKLQVDEFVLSNVKVNVAFAALGGKPLTVTIPDIRMTGLGQGREGITAADLADKLFSQVLTAVIPAVTKSLTDVGALGGEAIKGASKILGDEAGKATKSIGDLFKKK